MDWISDPTIWTALLTLTALEIVLGVDNVIFISILSNKLPEAQRDKARLVGLGAAMGMRIALLFAISWLVGLTEPWFEVFGQEISGRDMILLIGGLFLLYKATTELHEKLEGPEVNKAAAGATSFASVIAQIMILDIVFSLDSVITAVGMADDIGVMVAAVVIAVGVMMIAAKPLSEFVQAHPTVKVLALAFLLLIGMSLVAEGFGHHIPKGYIYSAMAFSVIVEMINLRVRSQGDAHKVNLHDKYSEEDRLKAVAGIK
ncbi:MAG: TerC family protein [Chloroflexota bacterium]|jgi:predicted tellurium resistance membrane protein TerC|nr:TerC family protein [Chloroflexia bacterium]MDQ3443497.1 TerC family protein [Chloroflexota bacterium]